MAHVAEAVPAWVGGALGALAELALSTSREHPGRAGSLSSRCSMLFMYQVACVPAFRVARRAGEGDPARGGLSGTRCPTAQGRRCGSSRRGLPPACTSNIVSRSSAGSEPGGARRRDRKQPKRSHTFKLARQAAETASRRGQPPRRREPAAPLPARRWRQVVWQRRRAADSRRGGRRDRDRDKKNKKSRDRDTEGRDRDRRREDRDRDRDRRDRDRDRDTCSRRAAHVAAATRAPPTRALRRRPRPHTRRRRRGCTRSSSRRPCHPWRRAA